MPTPNTKQVLAATLKQLMKTTSLDHITIDKLAVAAHINRNTFYYHFDDIHSLLAWVYERDVVTALKQRSDIQHWQAAYQLMLTYIAANQQLCLNTFHSLNRDVLDDLLYRHAAEMVDLVVTSIDSQTPIRVRMAITDFYGWAITAQVTQWLASELAETQESMIRKAELMMDGTLAHIIARGKTDPYFGRRE
ncbi:TetR/AcrR family transcriptional regulator [Lacticaseibacillus baoqingensis]|uniref:TetR/AcrR family transcriptional regulator n=1 Tax=Lacticaseibacillus baoqingensis TaxID=2486013 RepID=A0ABW4E8L9_9LACO|nr:TetR-like C-terminal domain-containing protein [Lacticaseibacillus baoqingensis]